MSESVKVDLIALRDSILGNAYLGQDHEIELIDKIRAAYAAALAEARAEGRRQGLPDLTDMQVDMLSVQLATALLQTAPMEPGRIDPLRRVRPMVRDLYETIRSLATTPPETQKPEETA